MTDYKYDIFISYSNLDSDIVHLYAQKLEEEGYSVWYDVKGLYTGAHFSEEIVRAIEDSRLFIFFSSEHSNASKWTRGEILTAQKFNKNILPVRLDESDYDKSLMLVLLPLQYVNVGYKYKDNIFNKLCESIKEFLGEPKDSTSVPNTPINDRKKSLSIMIFSSFVSIVMSIVMMLASGEFFLNYSLSFFAVFVSSMCCIALSAYIIYIENNWNLRSTVLNSILICGQIFFLSYLVMALGLCFISWDVFQLNLTSIPCAAMSVYSLLQIGSLRKRGYKLLCCCGLLFSIGSYWWLGHNIIAPFVVLLLSCLGLFIIKRIMITTNYWNKLR